MQKPLRHGYTTGTCAAAACAGAVRMLARQRIARQVTISLPAGFRVCLQLQDTAFTTFQASCSVVKDAGDDPDVTHGATIACQAVWDPAAPAREITLLAGEGVGMVTKPGLAVPPGEPAINPVPRKMITEAVYRELVNAGLFSAVKLTVSVPDGRMRAARTLNERLGIVGGLSILGTSGVVRPVSHQAWRDTIDSALNVAIASGIDTVVFSGGRSSEEAARRCLRLPVEAFILMGDHVGYALDACRGKNVAEVWVCLQFAKLVKVAAKHAWTHAHVSELNLDELATWAEQDGLDDWAVRQIKLANTAREAFLRQDNPRGLGEVVGLRALQAIRLRLPKVSCRILLVDYGGQVAGQFSDDLLPERNDQK